MSTSPKNSLFIVATPIGNLQDLSFRALNTFKNSSLFLAEDTRSARKLLSAFRLPSKYIISLPAFAEEKKVEKTLKFLEQGKNVSLLTRAGTPGISDPGHIIVQACLKKGFRVVPIPGPSAVTAALSVSGFPCSPFLFLGFLPEKKSKRMRILQNSLALECTLVIFLAPHDLPKRIEELAELAPQRPSTFCRELTKVHEEILHMPLHLLAAELRQRGKIFGECTLVIGPP
ncbi:MAG: 16S rRNA (cytidine(1402)-2'-O)-methyltransferase [bacterium JZ-2024 1]